MTFTQLVFSSSPNLLSVRFLPQLHQAKLTRFFWSSGVEGLTGLGGDRGPAGPQGPSGGTGTPGSTGQPGEQTQNTQVQHTSTRVSFPHVKILLPTVGGAGVTPH